MKNENVDKPIWIDSHCHLDMLKREAKDVLKQSFDMGTRTCVTIGINHESNFKVDRLAREFEPIYGTLGIHPHEASGFEPEHLETIKEKVASNKKIVAIGECGFDLHYEFSDRKDQKKVFEAQLSMAAELGLPIVIHSRRADRETLDMLKTFRNENLSGVIHCFSSDKKQAKRLLNAGFHLSFNGIATFPKSFQNREVLKYVPRDRMVLETDAPFLSPVPRRGRPNFPGNVSIIGAYIADFLKIPVLDFSEIIAENTLNLFPRILNES